MASEGKIKIFISKIILDELITVLKRDFNSSDEDIQEAILLTESCASLVELNEIPEIVKEDPRDNHIMACAEEADVDYIVTGDNHLLNMRKYNNILILKPSEFLEVIK